MEWKEGRKILGIVLPDLKTSCGPTVIKIVWDWQRDTENLEIDAHRQSQWIILASLQKQLYKGWSPQQMTVDQLDICINK